MTNEMKLIERIVRLEKEVARLQVLERAITHGLSDLTDPDADRILFWDDSEGALKWLTVGSGLNVTATTLTAT